MRYDVVIVGGGMVGLALACALPKQRIALIDAVPITPSNDPRLIALTYSSCCLLKNLGVWSSLSEHATPIKQIHVSHRGHFGITRIHAHELKLPELGYLIPAKYINAALEEQLKQLSHVDVLRPATLKTLSQLEDHVTLSLQLGDDIKTLTANKVIGADGTHSTVRDLLNIPTKTIDYHQSAIVTITELQRHHDSIAYERFLKQGAIAMLPMTENRVATIWTDDTDTISALLKLDDAEFLKTLQQHFGYRLGRLLKIHQRHIFPLKLILAEKQHVEHITLIGNAAHTLHPVAAQGLNLALYEVAELSQAARGDTSTYLQESEHVKINKQLSHQLTWLFSADYFMMNQARQLAMIGLDLSTTAKNFLMKKIMHRFGRMPYLLETRNDYASETTER